MTLARLRAVCRQALVTTRWQTVRNSHVLVRGQKYAQDEWTNIPSTILHKLDAPSPLAIPNHPLAILKRRIEQSLPDFESLSTSNPVVSVAQNFDELGFPPDHPGRSKTDSYYLNKDTMLQTHTSAHEIAIFRSERPKWLLTADVYRRDEIDSSHYPVFHQMEGARLLSSGTTTAQSLAEENQLLSEQLSRENLIIEDTSSIGSHNPRQDCHDPLMADLMAANLKLTLNRLIINVFSSHELNSQSEPLRVRWINAYFPWTTPSYEVEVLFAGKWLEILGCGVVQDTSLNRAGRKNTIAWAFGLGLERICMPLFSIPDIRLFWTKDDRFLSQFHKDTISLFQPYSKFPSNWKDISFWSPEEELHDNDIFDLVRDVAGDIVESVACVDKFVHPKTNRKSFCYRIHYRSMDRSLSNEELGGLQEQIKHRLVSELNVEIR